jgi:hypothetical protein
MDMDRERDRGPAADTEAQYKAQQEKLWQKQALDLKVWRTLNFGEKSAYQCLRDAYKNDDDCVPLSVFA